MDVSKTMKITASVLTIAGLVFGGVFFMDDRHQKVADAKTSHTYIEKAAVYSFQQQQQLRDLELLDLWRYKLREVERLLEKNPLSTELKRRWEWIKNKIKRIEDRLYQ